jgi:outer membrane protein assembly factor BamE
MIIRMHRLSFAVLAGALAGCGSLPSIPVPTIPGVTPYRIDIQQGNFVSQEMVAQLKPGMSREQVRFVLGTPLVADIFHADRWDYVYYRDTPGKPRETRKLSVFFEDNKLARVVGDTMPSIPASVEPATAQPAATAPKPAPKPEPVASPAPEPAPRQNWGTASDQPEAPKEAAAPEPARAADAPQGRSLLDRMVDRIRGRE